MRELRRSETPLLVPVEELQHYFRQAINDVTETTNTVGYFEAGVYAGQSMSTWWHETQRIGVPTTIVGADSFRGLPATAINDGFQPGSLACARSVTEWNLNRLGVPIEDVQLVEGWFDETLNSVLAASIRPVHVALVDAQTYSSTVTAMAFLSRVLADRCWIIFDDWYLGGNYDPATGGSNGVGVERAYREWLRSDQCRWIASRVGTYHMTTGDVSQPSGQVFRLVAAS